MAITASRNLAWQTEPGSGTLNIEATNTTVFYRGGFYMLNTTTGYAAAPADTSGYLWLGICGRQVTGDTGASPVAKVEIITGPLILTYYPVTGASAITNQGTLVYVTDNATLTTSATSNTKAVGYILKWHVSTNCDVYILSPEASRALN